MKKNYLLLICFFVACLSNAQTINFPDSNLRQLFLDGFFTSDENGNSIMIDINGDGEIQQSEALLVYNLSLDYSILNGAGLQYFTNVENFYFDGGNPALTTLDLSAMTNLKYLTCRHTGLNNVSFSGANLIELNLTSNALTSVDLSAMSGSSAIANIDLSYNNLSLIDLSPLSTCPSLTWINLNENNLASLDWSPFSGNSMISEIFARNNQIAAFDFSTVNAAITRINLHNNQLAQVDFSQLNHPLEALHVEDNPYVYFDTAGLTHVDTLTAGSDALLDAKFTVYNFDSVYLAGQNINSIDFKNGHNEACFSLFNLCFSGPQFGTFKNVNQIMCVDDFPNFVEEGPSIVDKSERNYWNWMINGEPASGPVDPLLGPHISTYCTYEPGGGYNTIAGKVSYDCSGSNQDLPQIPVRIVEGGLNSATATDATGKYRLYTIQNAVTVTPDLEYPSYFTVTPANYTYNFSTTGNLEVADFCLSPNGVHHNIELNLFPFTAARPGFDATYLISYKNNGNQSASGTITFTFDDAIMDFVNATPLSDIQNPNVLTWNFTNLAPFESRSILLVLNVNSPLETPAVNLGDVLTFSAQATTVETDEFLDDNNGTINQVVVGSFDPNDKQVSEGSQVSIDNAGDYLHYIIRFQNMGTAPAENVVIEDYLESDLDRSTLEVISASHPYRTTMTNVNQFEVFFEDINLPASIDDEPASHGYVAFKIKPVSGITVGTQIKNKADIHFDFNFPVVTNEVTTTFETLATENFAAADNIVVYPNPAQNVLNIRNNNVDDIKAIEIYNLLGQLIYTVDVDKKQRQLSLDVSSLQSGNYFMRIVTQNAVSTKHFLKK